jgi:ABC-type uncharacterized transport system auxiliary subunit
VSLKIITLIFCVIAIASCSFSGGQIPADHYYRLPEALVEKNDQFKFDSFLLNPVRVEGLYHERSILYVEKPSPLEVKRYHYHYWVETPAKLIRKYAYSYLSKSGISRKVSLITNSQSADVETDITIVNLERIMDQGSAQILISLRLSAKYGEGSQGRFNRLYTETVKVDSNAMHATIEAFGSGLNQIMDKFVADLRKNT